MGVDLFSDLVLGFIRYLPLIVGAYITVLILRFPDLTIEASWSIAGIVSCSLLKNSTNIHPLIAPFMGIIIGALCGLLTGIIFIRCGKVKLLSGLIAYYILMALGFHLLGDDASIYLDRSKSYFGFPENEIARFILYGIFSISTFGLLFFWQKSPLGIKTRLLGVRPKASKFFGLSLDRYFLLGLIISNAIVGFGGSLWAVYYGQATNIQGIGLVLKAFLALLIGDEILKLVFNSRRSVPISALLGTMIFVFLVQLTELAKNKIMIYIPNFGFKPTDVQFLVALLLIILLWKRRKNLDEDNAIVSEW